MTTKALNPLDASWLLVESRETPMHVAGLIIFQLPDDAPKDFFLDLMAEFRGTQRFAAPWNQKLRSMSLKSLMPVWESTEEIDLEHHMRHAALPQPGGERELGQLIARLHSQPLDLTRPPWECSLIEGLENRRFAFYLKMHHSLIDGISGMKMLVRAMSADPQESHKLPAFWAIGSGKGASKLRSARAAIAPTTAEAAAAAWSVVREQVTSVPGVLRAFGSMLGLTGRAGKMMVPFDTPSSIFNGRIKGQRRFATQVYALDRLRQVASNSGATLNDVVLAICGGALRRFLLELDALPKKPLTAGIPVSVRPKDDEGAGNAITFIISTLGTDIDDPMQRLQAITASTKLAKEHVQSLPRQAMMQYTMVLMAPYMVSLVTGVGGRTRPMFNITISNVPGPEQVLYFRGARMEATYPVSLVSHGQALNITCQSYGGNLAFGFTGCRNTLPHMQRIATYTGEALEELEQVVTAAQAAVKKASAKKAGTSKAGAKGARSGKAEKASAQTDAAKTSSKASSTKAAAKKALSKKTAARKAGGGKSRAKISGAMEAASSLSKMPTGPKRDRAGSRATPTAAAVDTALAAEASFATTAGADPTQLKAVRKQKPVRKPAAKPKAAPARKAATVTPAAAESAKPVSAAPKRTKAPVQSASRTATRKESSAKPNKPRAARPAKPLKNASKTADAAPGSVTTPAEVAPGPRRRIAKLTPVKR